MSYKEENDALINSFMERTYYRAMREGPNTKFLNWRNFEIILNYDCNLACRYCYGNRFGNCLCPEGSTNEDDIKKNTDIILDWFFENKFDPKIELFAGDVLVQDIGYWVVNRILDRGRGKLSGPLVIPTNYTFILSDELTNKAENLIQKSKEYNIPMSFSASFDGKYCEENRPFLYMVKNGWEDEKRVWHWEMNDKKDIRDDIYYDKCFSFAKKHGFGFHPMIYSYTIQNWEKNFLWFQEMLKKHNIPWYNIYLLEIRNVEWTLQQTQKFGEFIKFLIKWSYNMVGKNLQNYFDFLFDKRGFNILTSPLTTIGRGIGCSMQSDIYCRVGDLELGICHRTMYDHLNMGNFKVENNRIVGIDVKNPELWLMSRTLNSNTLPYCESCLLRNLCSKGCLGAQFEVTGDIFTPIPTVCRLEHEKIKSMIEAYKEIGIWHDILGRANEDKKRDLMEIEKMMNNGSC
jgi:radical SAM protein with 4Fe4S-binding SPASM domain